MLDEPLIDHGTAPKFYVSGLARVTPMGHVALFSFYVSKPQDDGMYRAIEVELIAPIEAVGPAFDMAITVLGARAMLGLAGQAVSQVVTSAVRRMMQ